jgi:excisionase family DNA binding protein
MSTCNGQLLLSADEVAELLTVSRTTFNSMVSDGWPVAPIMLGKRKRWLRSAIIEWLEQQSRQAPQGAEE